METRELLMALLHADAESDVVEVLKTAGYWYDESAWRFYGDDEGNYRIGGNQAGRAEPALVEKITNSIDAMLIRRCLETGIDPTSAAAPKSVRDAVAMFYEDGRTGSYHGNFENWTPAEIRDSARDICVSLTGETPRSASGSGYPSITIVDAGEGQTPEQLPLTILSLKKGLKSDIPFVQGKFNMGGTAALRFAGSHNLQLVLSKRSPKLTEREGGSTQWGFTVVRLETFPGARMSTYRYLAPIDSAGNPNAGGVLRVDDVSLPVLPDGNQAYTRDALWGTLIKLYEYRTRARTSFFQRSGLLNPLDVFLPKLPLPVRLHECRAFRGHSGSFETTLTGLEFRLKRSGALDMGPDSGVFTARGTPVRYTLYCTSDGAARNYRGDDAVIFSVNGQTHATLSERFFRRNRIAMGILAKDITVVLDCSELDVRSQEQLFLNSRDRLADSDIRRDIEEHLEIALREHPGLRELREQRIQREAEERLGNDKPLADTLSEILRKNPVLSRIFLTGERLSNPFNSRGSQKLATTFRGKRHPEVFKFLNIAYGRELERSCHLGQRFRIDFDTDAEDDYFRRDSDPGQLTVTATINDSPCTVDYVLNPFRGIHHLNCKLPQDAEVGDRVRLEVRVDDINRQEPFINVACLEVMDGPRKRTGTAKGKRREGKDPGSDDLKPIGLALPEVLRIRQDGWPDYDMDDQSALRINRISSADENEPARFRFYVNVDNIYLKTEQKAEPEAARLSEERFVTGLTLIGLGIIRQRDASPGGTVPPVAGADSVPDVEDLVKLATDGIGPMILPMIQSLAALEPSSIEDSESLAPDLAILE